MAQTSVYDEALGNRLQLACKAATQVTRLTSDKCCLLTKEEIKPKGWAAKERARECVGMSCVCHQTATL